MPATLALSDSEEEESLADSFEAQFQPVDHPSVLIVTEVVNQALRVRLRPR
jgi:hypothetical protein